MQPHACRAQKRAINGRSSSGLLEVSFDERQATLGLLAEQLFAVAAVALRGVQLIGNGKRGEHGDFLGIYGAGGIGDSVHFFVHKRSEFLDVSGFELAVNRVALPEDLYLYGTAHGGNCSAMQSLSWIDLWNAFGRKRVSPNFHR